MRSVLVIVVLLLAAGGQDVVLGQQAKRRHIVIRSEPGESGLPADEESVGQTMEALGGEFRRYETRHFVVIADTEPAWAQERGEILERTYTEFMRVMETLGVEAETPDNKLLCVLIEDHDRYMAFAIAQDGMRARWAGGYYALRTNRIVFYDDQTGDRADEAAGRLREVIDAAERAERLAQTADRSGHDDSAKRLRMIAAEHRARAGRMRKHLLEHLADASTSKTVHEAVHLIAYNSGVQLRTRQYPFWLSEGLATAFETAKPAERFGPASGRARRRDAFEKMLAHGGLTPLREFIAIDDPSQLDEKDITSVYAQSAALFRWLYEHEREALGDYIAELSAERIGRPRTDIAARWRALFAHHFGKVDELERRWLESERNGTRVIVTAPPE